MKLQLSNLFFLLYSVRRDLAVIPGSVSQVCRAGVMTGKLVTAWILSIASCRRLAPAAGRKCDGQADSEAAG